MLFSCCCGFFLFFVAGYAWMMGGWSRYSSCTHVPAVPNCGTVDLRSMFVIMYVLKPDRYDGLLVGWLVGAGPDRQ